MKDKTEKIRDHSLTAVMLLQTAALFIIAHILAAMCGDTAAGMAGFSLCFYFLIYSIYMFCGRNRVKRIVRMYRKNEFYINADEWSISVLVKSAVPLVIIAALLFVFGRDMAYSISGSVKGRLPIYILAVNLVLVGVESVLEGFIHGMGKKRIVAAADMLRFILSLVLSTVLSLIGASRGRELDALLYTGECEGAYAAMYAFIGILAADAAAFIVLLIGRFYTLNRLKPLTETGKPRYLGDKVLFYRPQVLEMTASAFPSVLILLLSAVYSMEYSSKDTGAVKGIGLLFGHYLPFVFVFGILCAFPFISKSYDIGYGEEKIDKNADFKFYHILRLQAALCFPVSALIMALSHLIEGGLFLIPDPSAQLMLLVGGLASTLISFSVSIAIIFVITKRQLPLFICAILGMIPGIAAAFIFTSVLKLGTLGTVIGFMISLIIFVIIGIVMLKTLFSMKKYRLFTTIIKPVYASTITGLITYFASMRLRYIIGEIPTTFACIVAGSLIYLILMSLSRGFEKNELMAIPGGRLFESISTRGIK